MCIIYCFSKARVVMQMYCRKKACTSWSCASNFTGKRESFPVLNQLPCNECMYVSGGIAPPILNLSNKFHCLEKSVTKRDLLWSRLSAVTNFCLFLPSWLTVSVWRCEVCGCVVGQRIWFWMCSWLCISITATLISFINTFAPSNTHK